MVGKAFFKRGNKIGSFFNGPQQSPQAERFLHDLFSQLLDIGKEDLLALLMDFNYKGNISKGLNVTFITLIPKRAEQTKLQNFGQLVSFYPPTRL